MTGNSNQQNHAEVLIESNRLEAFSDAVIAIVITIMVLEMKVPHEESPSALIPLVPVFLSYTLSFLYLAIYWNNHHHMMLTCCHVTGPILWSNMHLLFWLSLVPFVTGWLGENSFLPAPTAVYGIVLFMASVAYMTLQHFIIVSQGSDSILGAAIRRDWKGKLSMSLYAVSIPLAFWMHWVSLGIYVLVALLWLIPDQRIVQTLRNPNFED